MHEPPDDYGFNNVWYEPERYGLELVYTIEDPGACYDFTTFAVWYDPEEKCLFWASDSGCSCPSPFERIHSPADFDGRAYGSIKQLEQAATDWVRSYEGSAQHAFKMLAKIPDLVKASALRMFKDA